MKRHQLDFWSLIGGVVLAGLGLLVLIPADPFDLAIGFRNLFGWALPVLVILIGLALIAPALQRRHDETDAEILPPAPDPFEPL